MATGLRQDTYKLMVDEKRIRENIEKLERDCNNWATKREEKDLVDLIKTIKEVEIDVSLMLVDSISTEFCGGRTGMADLPADFLGSLLTWIPFLMRERRREQN